MKFGEQMLPKFHSDMIIQNPYLTSSISYDKMWFSDIETIPGCPACNEPMTQCWYSNLNVNLACCPS